MCLLIKCTLHGKSSKKYACLQCCCGFKTGVKWLICPQQKGPIWEILYVPILSVMTIHYQRLYQVSILEAEVKRHCIHPYTYRNPTSKLIMKPDLF